MQSGALVVFEGAEGVGKTTQLRLLAAALDRAGQRCVSLREPGGTALGEAIRSILLDSTVTPSGGAEALLFLASRAQLVSELVRPALARGEVVLLDRFFLSTYAYQVAGRGLDESEVMAANQLAVGRLIPDVTIVLDLPIEAGLARADARGERDRIEMADLAFHRRVSAAFSAFTNESWQRSHPESGPVVSVDARGSEDDVFARVKEAIRQHSHRLAEALGHTPNLVVR